MRVVFLGTPTFAVPALRMLLDHAYEVCGVFTQPDRPSGRGQKLQPSPIKALAGDYGIPVFQPDRIRNEENREIFQNLQPDFIVVVAYGQILPGWLLKTAKIAPVNVHASLLPRYRGAAPVSWAILNGDAATGVTTMLMAEGLDAGPILLQEAIPITLRQTTAELSAAISEVGAGLLIKTLDALARDAVKPVEQDESKVCWAPRITKEMAPIVWRKPALDIHNQIRGLIPWPIAHANFRGEHLRILRSLPVGEPADNSTEPGAYLGHSRDAIHVKCGEGTALRIEEVQMPGKSKISGREFANGARLIPGDIIFN